MIKQIAKISFFGLFLVCWVNTLVAQKRSATLDLQSGGLKFISQEAYVKDRTTLSLFPDNKKIKSNISLSFDCEFNDLRFGYIFRLISFENGKEKVMLHLLQNPVILDADTYKIELYSPVTQSTIDFILPAKRQNKLRFSISYYSDKQSITMSCNGVKKSLTGINLDNVKYNIVFGLWGLDEDVAPMTLRNIRIHENNINTYFWPLDEYGGSLAHERLQGIKSEVINPEWLRKEHYHWKKIGSIKADDMAGIIYKKPNQEFNIINKDSLVIFTPYSKSFEVVKYSNERPFAKHIHFSTYNESQNQIISYDFRFLKSPSGKKLYSVLDEEKMQWSSIDLTERKLRNHHHCSFWNTNAESLTIFAGYSDYTYYNNFNTFNFSTNTWSTEIMNGDIIFPREYTVIGQNEKTDLLYVFGGYGNESGKQGLGGQVFKDMFSVDLSKNLVKKIAEFDDFYPEYVPRGNLISGDQAGTIFYTLLGPKTYDLNLRLFEINLAKNTLTPVSDTLKVNLGPHKTHIRSNIYLFKDTVAQMLYCVCREVKDIENAEVAIYSLNFPPSTLPDNKPSRNLSINILLLSAFGLIVLLLLIYYFVIRRKSIVKTNTKPTVDYSRPDKNAIWFLGGFQIFDSQGSDITYRFSKKLKEFFVLILIETVQQGGLSSKELSDKLWPGMDNTQQKNNRGVTINAVRKVLTDIEGIALENINNKWIISFGNECYFDYGLLMTLLSQKDYLGQSDRVLSLMNYGNLTPRLQFPWLDNIKAKYDSQILSSLYDICENSISNKNYLSCLDTANIIHDKYDPLDETALRFKIIALNKMRGYSKSKNEFELFKKRYSSTYEEEYTRTMAEITHL